MKDRPNIAILLCVGLVVLVASAIPWGFASKNRGYAAGPSSARAASPTSTLAATDTSTLWGKTIGVMLVSAFSVFRIAKKRERNPWVFGGIAALLSFFFFILGGLAGLAIVLCYPKAVPTGTPEADSPSLTNGKSILPDRRSEWKSHLAVVAIIVLLLTIGVIVAITIPDVGAPQFRQMFEDAGRGRQLDQASRPFAAPVQTEENNHGLPEQITMDLHEAAETGNLAQVKANIFSNTHDANIDALNKEGFAPLHLAAKQGFAKIVALLLTQKADPNIRTSRSCLLKFANEDVFNDIPAGTTAIHLAAACGHKQTVGILLANGANPQIENSIGQKPSHYAATVDVLKVLLEHGGDIRAKDKLGNSLMHSHARLWHTDVIEYLIGEGLDINARNEDQLTPIGIFCKDRNNIFIHPNTDTTAEESKYFVRLLIAKGALVGDDSSGRTVLCWAARSDAKMLGLLLKKKLEVNVADTFGMTPLHWAARMGNLESTEMLLAGGADANTKSKHGDTALHIALFWNEYGTVGVIDALLAKGADVNARDKEGSTPLAVYISTKQEKSDLQLLKMLVSKGADVNARDGDGRTPISYIAEDSKVAVMLREYGGLK